jgi:hypothetical protein
VGIVVLIGIGSGIRFAGYAVAYGRFIAHAKGGYPGFKDRIQAVGRVVGEVFAEAFPVGPGIGG